MNFQFCEIAVEDFDRLIAWRLQPHVSRWWDEHTPEELLTEYQNGLLNSDSKIYIVSLDQEPIGSIQEYDAFKSGDGWWPDVETGTWGIDFFIGDETLLGRGIGTAMIRSFVEKLLARSKVKTIIADPHPDNLASIRACEKVGFRLVGPVSTPDGSAMLLEHRGRIP